MLLERVTTCLKIGDRCFALRANEFNTWEVATVSSDITGQNWNAKRGSVGADKEIGEG